MTRACRWRSGFTVETDGRLPDGTSLRDAIARVDAEARARLLPRQLRPPVARRPGPRHRGERLDQPDRRHPPERVPDVARRARRGARARRGRPRRPRRGDRRACARTCRTCASSAAAAAPTAATWPRCGASEPIGWSRRRICRPGQRRVGAARAMSACHDARGSCGHADSTLASTRRRADSSRRRPADGADSSLLGPGRRAALESSRPADAPTRRSVAPSWPPRHRS